MLKKVLLTMLALMMSMGLAMAQVDANKGDQAELDGIKGVGPVMSKRILEERKKGAFQNWAELETRVKGIGEKSAAKLSDAGLTVNGASRKKPAAVGEKAAQTVPTQRKEAPGKAHRPANAKQ